MCFIFHFESIDMLGNGFVYSLNFIVLILCFDLEFLGDEKLTTNL